MEGTESILSFDGGSRRSVVAATRPAWRVLKEQMHTATCQFPHGCSDSTRMEGTERAAARIDDLLKSSCCSDSTRMEGTESTKSHRLCTRSAWLQRLDPHGGY